MARISRHKRDLTDIAEVEYEEGMFVSLRQMPNPQFDAWMTRIKKSQLRKIRRDLMGDDEMLRLTKEAMANTIVTGWRGFDDDDDEPVLFSVKQCFDWFMDPALYDFYQFCRTESADIYNFRKEDEEDATGN